MAIGAMDAKRIEKLIDERASHVIDALEREVTANEGEIRELMLRNMGYPRDSYDINDELRRLSRHYEGIKFEHVDRDEITAILDQEGKEIGRQIDVEVESIRMQAQQDIARVKSDMELAIARTRATREERTRDIEDRKKARLTELFETHQPGLLGQIAQFKEELETVRKIEKEIEPDVKNQADMRERAKGRLIHLVKDARSRAKIELLKCESTADAARVLMMIPDVNEAIALAENPALGLDALVNRLGATPQMQLAPPKDKGAEPAPAYEATEQTADALLRVAPSIRIVDVDSES